jgi:hypothetical protein
MAGPPSVEQRVVQFLETNPGLKARDIANRVRSKRETVNKVLYALAREGRARKDNSHRWFLREDPTSRATWRKPDHSDAPPECPKCGEEMVERMAKHGVRKGKPFWGCPNFPGCDGLINIDGDQEEPSESNADSPLSAPSASVSPSVPRLLVAEPRRPGHRVQFFQVAPLPAPTVARLHDLDVSPAALRAYAHWRLDSPPPKAPLSQSLWSTVSVAETILTRGTVPHATPRVAEAVGQIGLESRDAAEGALSAICPQPTCVFAVLNYDSPEEQEFIESVLPSLSGDAASWAVTPQVHLSSLTGEAGSRADQRGDFLFTKADVPPLLVEIDGAQHEAHADADAQRDQKLSAAGVTVVRVPASEVRESYGPALSGLQQQLLSRVENVNVPPFPAELALRQGKFAGQVQLALLEALKTGWLDLESTWRIAVVLPEELGSVEESKNLVNAAVADLEEVLGRLLRLHGQVEKPPAARLRYTSPEDAAFGDVDVIIGAADGLMDGLQSNHAGRFEISDLGFPFPLQAPTTTASPVSIDTPSRQDARWFLEYIFGKEDFWPGQWETIERGLQGRDSVVLLPTGAVQARPLPFS